MSRITTAGLIIHSRLLSSFFVVVVFFFLPACFHFCFIDMTNESQGKEKEEWKEVLIVYQPFLCLHPVTWWYNKRCTFRHIVSKTLEIFPYMSIKCLMNGFSWVSLGWGPDARGTNYITVALWFSLPIPWFVQMGEAQRLNLSLIANDAITHVSKVKLQLKPEKTAFWELWGC